MSTLLAEKKAEERKCSIKFNGYFEYWKESKVVVNQKRLVFLTDKYSHKFNLAHLRIGN